MFLFRRNFTRKSFSSLDRWNVLRSSYLFVGHFSTQLYLSNYENYLRNLDKLWKKSRWHSYTIYHFNFTSNVFSRYPELFFVLLRREQKIKKNERNCVSMEDECQTNLLLEIGKIRGAQAGRILRGFAGFHRDLLLRFMQISLEGFLSEISNQSVVPPTSSIFEPRSPPYRVSTFILWFTANALFVWNV